MSSFLSNDHRKYIKDILTGAAVGAVTGLFVVAGLETMNKLKQITEAIRSIEHEQNRQYLELRSIQHEQTRQYLELRRMHDIQDDNVDNIMLLNSHIQNLIPMIGIQRNSLPFNNIVTLFEMDRMLTDALRSYDHLHTRHIPITHVPDQVPPAPLPYIRLRPTDRRYSPRETYTCGICLQEYNCANHPPVILSCHDSHTFCVDCINRYFENEHRQRHPYRCPTCRVVDIRSPFH